MEFEIPKLKKISDKDYFLIGKVNFFNHKELVVSASFLKQVFERDLYDVLIKGEKSIDAELQYMFDVGSAFHTFVLEANHFEERYYVADYKNEFESNTRTYINSEDYEFVVQCYNNIKLKYAYILEESNMNEVALFTNFDGTPYRCKIDKLLDKDIEIKIIDLKSVWFDFYGKKFKRNKDGIRWGLVKYIQELNYDLQGYAYWKAIKTYLESKGIDKEVSFSLLLASKETYDVKLVKFSAEMMANGKEKYDLIFPEIKSFFDGGYEFVEQEEII